MSNNISKVHDCYGCGVCAAACGRKIIEVSLNEDGFYEPHITDESKCTNCGICTEVCAYLHDELSLQNPKSNLMQHGVKTIWSEESARLEELDLKSASTC